MLEIIGLFLDRLYDCANYAMNLMFMKFRKSGMRITGIG